MRRKREPKNSGLLVHWPVIVFGSALIALISTLAYQASHSAPPSSGRGSGAVPVHYDRAGDAMPFPATLEPAGFKQTEVREAYQTAKEIPEVLAQQPCYCYCQRKGHRSLLDCFKTDHAASCSICIREALLAAQMHRQEKSAEEIRRAIVQGRGPAKGVQTNDCGKSSTTSTNPKKGNTDEDKTDSRKHHCVSHIVHDAHGGSNANAGEHTWDEQTG